MTDEKIYYKALVLLKIGEDVDITIDIIKRARRMLAKKYHSDVGGDEEKMKKINAAYDYLEKLIKEDKVPKKEERKRGKTGSSNQSRSFDYNPFSFFNDFGEQPTEQYVSIEVDLETLLTNKPFGIRPKFGPPIRFNYPGAFTLTKLYTSGFNKYFVNFVITNNKVKRRGNVFSIGVQEGICITKLDKELSRNDLRSILSVSNGTYVYNGIVTPYGKKNGLRALYKDAHCIMFENLGLPVIAQGGKVMNSVLLIPIAG